MNSLETQVLQLIGENTTSPDVFLDTDAGLEPVRDSLNAAIEEISMLTGMYEERYLIPLYQEQAYYRVDFSRGVFAYVIDGWLYNQNRRLVATSLPKLEASSGRWMIQTGTPTNYFMLGMDVIGVYPRPSGSSDTVELNCAVIPDRYTTSTDRIKLRDDFQKATIHYAVSEYWASRGDAAEARRHFRIYAKHVGITGQYPDSAERNYGFRRTDNENSPVS